MCLRDEMKKRKRNLKYERIQRTAAGFEDEEGMANSVL